MPETESLTTLHRRLGAVPQSGGRTQFRVWAPGQAVVEVYFPDRDETATMQRDGSGYHLAIIEGVTVGERYYYRLAGQIDRPDPASRFQPAGVHGPSQVIDPDFAWTDQSWSGVAVPELIIYELHLGTFTAAGTYLAATERLDELVDLGVTAIEIMPLADAPGRWNWGYDGVNWFAPNHNYGTPAQLRQLVDTAHRKGLAVILDVVYNHFGPEGNYLAEFGPYLSPRHVTAWGAAPNFDGPEQALELRRFVIANAIYWFDEYHFDALRVDAIHCMRDDSDRHVVLEMSEAVARWQTETKRPATLIAESNVYDPELLRPRAAGGFGFHAAWCDDFLHSLFAIFHPEQQRSDRQYDANTDLAQTLHDGYVYLGSMHTPNCRRQPMERVETSRLIYCIQNHDFIGNHPLGLRLHQVASREAQLAAAALLLLSPAIPMLFMGEEFACEQPFRFFVDFADQHLRQGVADGRQLEYPQHDWTSGLLPTDQRAFHESKLGPASDGDGQMRTWYRQLIRLRRDWMLEGLLCDANLTVETDPAAGLFVWRYRNDRQAATVAARLNRLPDSVDAMPWRTQGEIVLDSRPGSCGPAELLANHARVAIQG